MSVLKNVSGCTTNSLREVYTNRINDSLFTNEIQQGLLKDFRIKYTKPAGNDRMYDDTGLTWDSGLDIDSLTRYVEHNATCLDDLLYVVAAKEIMENPNRLVFVPETLAETVLSKKRFLKDRYNINVIVDFRTLMYVDLTWNSSSHEELMLQNLKNYLSSF
jgi:hypothetical protein